MGGVVGAVVGIKANRDAKKAQKRAAEGQKRAALESAKLLEEAGRKAEADIIRQNLLARESAEQAAIEGEEPISPFASLEAVQQAQDQIIGNLPISGALADSIRQASTEFIQSRPEFDLSGPVGAEVQRQGDLSVSAAQPQFDRSLFAAGQQGLAAAADVGQIRQRGLQRLGDIAGGEGAQRASVLVGQVPTLTRLATGAQEARLLGDVAGQQAQTQTAESLAGLAGQLLPPRVDEFGFKKGEDPFAEF